MKMNPDNALVKVLPSLFRPVGCCTKDLSVVMAILLLFESRLAKLLRLRWRYEQFGPLLLSRLRRPRSVRDEWLRQLISQPL
jgi:hypothetical protein